MITSSFPTNSPAAIHRQRVGPWSLQGRTHPHLWLAKRHTDRNHHGRCNRILASSHLEGLCIWMSCPWQRCPGSAPTRSSQSTGVSRSALRPASPGSQETCGRPLWQWTVGFGRPLFFFFVTQKTGVFGHFFSRTIMAVTIGAMTMSLN